MPENVPIGHAAHSTNPVTLFENEPIGHTVQDRSVSEARYEPSAHAVQTDAPTPLNSPGAHGVHSAAEGDPATVPAAHFAQVMCPD